MKNYIFLLAVVFASPTQAAILITNSGGQFVSGITGLVVNGDVYDVTFSGLHSFDSRFGVGDPPPVVPTFYFDASGAIAARDAIVAAFNSAPVIPIGVNDLRSALVPYRFDSDPDNFYRVAELYRDLDRPIPPPWGTVGLYGDVYSRQFKAQLFAEFYPVPEPASIAAWLGLMAAGASIAYRRREQQ